MMTDKQVEDFLEHFGKKGMRWGVRKKSNSSTGMGYFKTSKQEVNQRKHRGKKSSESFLKSHGTLKMSFLDGSRRETTISTFRNGGSITRNKYS